MTKPNEERVSMQRLDPAGTELPEGTDVLQLILDRQRDLLSAYQVRYVEHYGPCTADVAGRVQALVDNAITELIELKDWLPWKYWKRYEDRTFDRKEVAFEVIDVMHMLVEIFLELGISTSEEVGRLYIAKNVLNQERLEGKHGYGK